jgi:sugar/nucleoside kinase (ribokinase family)
MVEFAFVGGLREDYALLPYGEARLRQPGGSAVYAAAGARVWTPQVGLVGRVGANYPADWLARLAERGLDIAGVKVLPDSQDTRAFYAYLSLEERVTSDPATQFSRVGLPMPPELAGYSPPESLPVYRDKFGPLSVRPGDVPPQYSTALGFHFAPDDLVVHATLPMTLRQQGMRYLTCDPSPGYMVPAFLEEVKNVVRGLDAFLPSEAEARTLFAGPGGAAVDLWQAAEAFGAMGARIVVIKSGTRGQLVYDAEARRKWHVPAYPARAKDVTGAGDAYCGGFLVGLAGSNDAVEAAVRGAVSASVVVEGTGVLYALDSTPGLAEARAQALRDGVRQI